MPFKPELNNSQTVPRQISSDILDKLVSLGREESLYAGILRRLQKSNEVGSSEDGRQADGVTARPSGHESEIGWEVLDNWSLPSVRIFGID